MNADVNQTSIWVQAAPLAVFTLLNSLVALLIAAYFNGGLEQTKTKFASAQVLYVKRVEASSRLRDMHFNGQLPLYLAEPDHRIRWLSKRRFVMAQADGIREFSRDYAGILPTKVSAYLDLARQSAQRYQSLAEFSPENQQLTDEQLSANEAQLTEANTQMVSNVWLASEQLTSFVLEAAGERLYDN